VNGFLEGGRRVYIIITLPKLIFLVQNFAHLSEIGCRNHSWYLFLKVPQAEENIANFGACGQSLCATRYTYMKLTLYISLPLA
jgi:hypothetical protein